MGKISPKVNGPVTGTLFGVYQSFQGGQPASSLSVHNQLYHLCQNKSSVSDYTLQFHTLANFSGWKETALMTPFRQGLNPDIRQQMTIYDDVIGLESFIQSTRISQHLTACALEWPTQIPLSASPSVAPAAPEPMQIDTFHQTRVERQ